MRLGERFDLAGLRDGLFGEAQRADDDIERVAHVLEFAVECIAVTIEGKRSTWTW